MPTQTFPFDNPANYTPSDVDKLQISGGVASLKLGDYPDNDFTENFDSETGHVHDANSEITGSKWQQVNKRPDGAVFYAKLYDSINANWGDGSLVGTAYNGAAIIDNLLNLEGGVAQKYVSYNPTGNIPGAQKGCIRIKNYIPNYSGAPATGQFLYAIGKDLSTKNYVSIYHYTNGYIRGTVYDQNGVVLGETLYYWITGVAGTPYEIEFNYDLDTGNMYLFVDGTLRGLDTGATGTRTDDITYMFVGRTYNPSTPDFSIGQILVFDDMQHTSGYTPDWSGIPDTDYLQSYDTLPEMEYTGAGTLVLLTALTYLKQGGLKIALQKDRSGVWDYWNGSAWATGDGTKDFMCTIEDFVANIATLVVLGSTIGQFKLYLPDSNTQGYIDFLTATLTAQIYPTDNQYYDINSRWYTDGLELISAVKTITGDDNIKIALKKGDTYYYISSGVLTESDGTYSQSTTVEDWETYKALFTDVKTYICIRIFFHSEDGQSTPELDTLTIGYNYAGVAPDTVDTCIVDCTYIDANGTPTQSTIKYRRIFPAEQYKTSTIVERELLEKTPDTTGYWDIELVPGNYKFIINEKIFYKIVPEETEVNFWDLEDWS